MEFIDGPFLSDEIDQENMATYRMLTKLSSINTDKIDECEIGDVVEFSPASVGLSYEIASRISLCGGGTLQEKTTQSGT